MLPRTTFAGPPGGASGGMVLDEVADGLRRYRAEKDLLRRRVHLAKLAPTHDPRAAGLLGEWLTDEVLQSTAVELLIRDFGVQDRRAFPGALAVDPGLDECKKWGKSNEADLRRRARELPQ